MTASIPEFYIPTLTEGTLPPMLVSENQYGRYEVLIYDEQEDPEDESSCIGQCLAIGVLVMADDDEDAIVRFTDLFVVANPWIENYEVKLRDNRWVMTKKDKDRPARPDDESLIDELLTPYFFEKSEIEQIRYLQFNLDRRRYRAGATYALGWLAKELGISAALKQVFKDDAPKLLSMIFFLNQESTGWDDYNYLPSCTLLPYQKKLGEKAITGLLKKLTPQKAGRLLSVLRKSWMQNSQGPERKTALAFDLTSLDAYRAALAPETIEEAEKRRHAIALGQTCALAVWDRHTVTPLYCRTCTGPLPGIKTIAGQIKKALGDAGDYRTILVSERGRIKFDCVTQALENDLRFLFSCDVHEYAVQSVIDKNYDKLLLDETYNEDLDEHVVTCALYFKYRPSGSAGRGTASAARVYLHIYFDEKENGAAKVFRTVGLGNLKDTLVEPERYAGKPGFLRDLKENGFVWKNGQWQLDPAKIKYAMRLEGVRALITDCIADRLEADRIFKEREKIQEDFDYFDRRAKQDVLPDELRKRSSLLQFFASALSYLARFRCALYKSTLTKEECNDQYYLIHERFSISELKEVEAQYFEGRGFLFDKDLGLAEDRLKVMGVPIPATDRFYKDFQDLMAQAEEA